jgi:Flp pilus assembly pilin Flp
MDRRRRGQSLVEYTLILGLMVLVVVAALGVFGQSVSHSLNATAHRAGSLP